MSAPRRPHTDPLRVAATLADAHLASARTRRVTGTARPAALARHLTRKYDFATPHDAADVLDDLASMLRRGTVHGGPTHFGPFAPSVPREAVAASTLVAAFNPQRAIRAHAHAAHAIEQHVLHFLAAQLGYDPETSAAHFCAGGQEANLTALLCALVHTWPTVRARGVRALPGDPVVYASAEAHHGLEKAAHAAGLGRDAVDSNSPSMTRFASTPTRSNHASPQTACTACSPSPSSPRPAPPRQAPSIRSPPSPHSAPASASGSTWTRRLAVRPPSPPRCAVVSTESPTPTRSRGTPTNGCKCRSGQACTSPAIPPRCAPPSTPTRPTCPTAIRRTTSPSTPPSPGAAAPPESHSSPRSRRAASRESPPRSNPIFDSRTHSDTDF